LSAHEVTLLGREEVALGTMAFRLSRPADFDFKAGQSATVALLEPPAEPNSAQRIFSLASAPFESDLMVATRMRDASAFKQALKHLPMGSRLKLRGPRGAMTLHHDASRPALFIAGGIGITPFMSMLRQAAHEPARPLHLLYSNRRPQDAAFLGELQAMRHLKLTARMTDAEGFVDEAAVRRFAGDAAPAPVYYLAGPPAMVNAMKGILRTAGVADADVRSEQFYGY
jgi:ferredoxin-NADP reductase